MQTDVAARDTDRQQGHARNGDRDRGPARGQAPLGKEHMYTRITTILLLLIAASLAFAAPPPSAVYSLTLEKGAAGGGDLAVRVVTTLGAVTEGRAGDAAADVAGVTADATGLRGDVKVGADLWTLRFAPFYPPSGDTRLFPGRDEALAWSRDATDKAAARDGATDMRLLPAAPLPYRDALGFGLQQNVLAALEDLRQAFGAAIEASREGKGPRRQLLVEPFGTASRGLAGFYRYSLLGEAGYASPLATGAAIPWRRLWFRRDAAEQRIHRLAQETLGLSCVVAPLIQDSGTLFMESGPSRTLLVLGPGAAAADAVPPELAITSPAAPSEEQSRAWTQAEAAIEEQATTITDVLAAAAGVPPAALQVAASFVIREHAWRPAFTIYRRDDAADGAVVPLGLDDAALQATAIGLERQLGRKWIYCQQSGEQGFLSSAVTAPVAAG